MSLCHFEKDKNVSLMSIDTKENFIVQEKMQLGLKSNQYSLIQMCRIQSGHLRDLSHALQTRSTGQHYNKDKDV